MVAERAAADRSEARLLAAVVHFVDLHPVAGDTRAAMVSMSSASDSGAGSGPGSAVTWARPGSAPVARAGTPEVAEDAVEELAAALNLSRDGHR
ncbi:MAG: hypothetical protein ABI776_05520 [Nocardioidaceae bacterium]